MQLFFTKDSMTEERYATFRTLLKQRITEKYEIYDSVTLEELATDVIIKLIDNKKFDKTICKSIGDAFITKTTKFVVTDFLEKNENEKKLFVTKKNITKGEEEDEEFDFENLCENMKEVNQNSLGYYFFMKKLEKILDHQDFSLLNYKILGLTNIEIGKKMKISDDSVSDKLKKIYQNLSKQLISEDWI